MKTLAILILSAGALAAADAARVMAEPNLEKRSRLALAEAETALNDAKTAYEANNLDLTAANLNAVAAMVELAHESLLATNKIPRKSPKHFKHAEITARSLVRRLDAFENAMSAADRELVPPIHKRVAAVGDSLLESLMEKKRR